MTKLDELCAFLKDAPDEIFIQPHNVPDPDAIASSAGLRYLLEQRGFSPKIIYDSEIEKANSLKMLELFKVDMVPVHEVKTLDARDITILVDVQKGGSNLTDTLADEAACIDHHELLDSADFRFADIRPEIGSCSAIIASYYVENKVEIPTHIATALLYGIFMDTANLMRGVNHLDIDMFYTLYGISNTDLIMMLRGNEISSEDLQLYAKAFQTVEIYDEIGFLRLENANDSLLGAAGDIVNSVAGLNVVVAYALREGGVKISIRSINKRVNAADMVRAIVKGVGVGGGHNNMAGGFIMDNRALFRTRLPDTFIKYRAIAFFESSV